MRVAKITSLILKILLSICVVVGLVGFVLYFGLLSGIKVDQLSLGNFKVEQFYLKLDKKIIFTAREIEVTKDDTEGLIEPKINQRTISLAQRILDNFQLIDIKRFKYDDLNGSFKLNGTNILLTSTLADLNATYKNNGEKYDVSIHNLLLKDKNITASGTFLSDIKTKEINAKLNVFYKDANISIQIDKPDEKATIKLSSNTLKSLGIIKDFTKLDGAVDEWLFKRLKINSFKINGLKVVYDTAEEEVLYDKLSANIFVNNISLKFNDKVDAVVATNANVTLSNTNLKMIFQNPKLKSKSLNGSTASINSLFSSPSLSLNLKYDDKLDAVIFDVLKAYNLDLPTIVQSRGKTKAVLNMFLPFDDRELKISVDALASDSLYEVQNNVIDAKRLNFKYDKNIFITNSEIGFKDVNASIDNFVFLLDNKYLRFDGGVSLPKVGKVKLQATSNIDDKNFVAKVFIDKFAYENFIDLQKQELDIFGNFNNGLNVFIPDLNLKYTKLDELNTISVSNIERLTSFSPIAKEYNIKDGTFNVSTKDFENIDFGFVVREPLLPVELKANNKDLSVFEFKGTKRGDKITLEEKNKNIKVVKNGNIFVDIKNLHIIQKPSVEKKADEKKESLYEMVSKPLNLPNAKVDIANSIFEDEKGKKYIIDDLNINTNKEDIELDFKTGVTRLSLKKNDKKIELSAIKLTDKFLNFISDKEIFYNGYASLKGSGTIAKVDGFINVYDLDIVGVPIVNNITKGSATFSFDTKQELLSITKIDTTGTVVDLGGRAMLDLKNSKIDASLDVIFINTIADAIRNIPLIGYIFFGDDAKLHLNATVSGSLADPKVETHFVKGTSEGVVNIIKRILLLPVTAVEKLNETSKEETKQQ